MIKSSKTKSRLRINEVWLYHWSAHTPNMEIYTDKGPSNPTEPLLLLFHMFSQFITSRQTSCEEPNHYDIWSQLVGYFSRMDREKPDKKTTKITIVFPHHWYQHSTCSRSSDEHVITNMGFKLSLHYLSNMHTW